MNKVGKSYWVISTSFSFLFFALLFVHIPFFTFAPMSCCLLCCICSCCWLFCWLLSVNGKRSCLYQVSWFNKKKEEALYGFGHAFFGFLQVSVVLFAFVVLLFFFSISFVCIELCLRTTNAIAHCTQINNYFVVYSRI